MRLTPPTDMLDDFSAVKVDTKETQAPSQAAQPAPAPEAAAPKAAPGPGPASLDADLSEDDFAKQLQEGMADLLGQLDQSVRLPKTGHSRPFPVTSNLFSQPDMQAQFEEMFKHMNSVAGETETQPEAGSSSKGDATKPAPAQATDASFQDTIRRTMERMQNSGDQATNAAAASGSDDDFMSEMLKQLSSGEGNEEDFSKMLMGMMEQLTNKEILYEPMKELNEKFPEWMEKNKASTPADDLKRYEEQQTLVAEIVTRFETSTYSDANAADREYIVDRMQKVSTHSRRNIYLSLKLTQDRCKPQARLPPIWLEVCLPHRKLSTCRTSSATPSNRRTYIVYSNIPEAVHGLHFGHAFPIFTSV